MGFQFQNIADYHAQLERGETSCFEVVGHYLSCIKTSSHLNAFVAVFEDEVLDRAAELDAERKTHGIRGELHGVVVGVKDVICYKDHPVTAGSKMLNGFHSLYNATAIQKLLDAGALIIGMCNCDEFAMGSTNENSAYGPVLNADDVTRVPGGSSGGSAVAVQAGLCMVSLGSDTGGSVRQPADFCGIVGLKPTYGRISRYGLIAYASSFDQVGIFGQNVPDVAAVLETISGHDEMDSTSGTEEKMAKIFDDSSSGNVTGTKFRFAYLQPTMDLPGLDPEIKAAISGYFDRLSSEGHTVEAVPFDLLDFIVPAYYVLTTAEASSNLGRFDGVRYGHNSATPPADLTDYYKQNRSEGFGKEVKRRIMLGSFVLSAGYYDAYFAKAQQVRRLICDQTAAIFEKYDAILMPVSPATAFVLGEKMDDPVAMYLADIYTVFANLAGLPGMSIPLFRHSNGMKFGVQVLTKKWDEVSLHRISHYLHSHW
jgi:aspartyl-tRNA(Asn)/glutamyl-tRNA(Gln) amidotransferase subunit A